jgi:DNA-damage-inducible protein J
MKRRPDASRQAALIAPLTPNAETIEAMEAARRGDVVKVGGVNDLLADLQADGDSWEGE